MQLEDLKDQNHNLWVALRIFMIFADKAPAGNVKIREASLAAPLLTSGWLITILLGSDLVFISGSESGASVKMGRWRRL